VDGAKESFTLTRAGDYRSGRFARIRVEVRDLDGRLLPVRTSFGLADGGVAGEYEVRLGYHDRVAVANEERVDGLALMWSRPFRIRLVPPPIRVTRARIDELKREFAALDVARPPPMVAVPWREDLEFDGPPETAADRLFRAGLAAVPALLEVLEGPKLSPAARAQALAMLWNLTGMHEPTAGAHPAALGAVKWHYHWPGVVADAPAQWESPAPPIGLHPMALLRSESEQKVVVDRWLALKEWWPIAIEK